MTKLQQDIFNKHLKLVEPILKSYLLNHPLPSNEDIEDFKQKIYLRLLEICCNENFELSHLTDGFIKQSTYFAIMKVYRDYNSASYKYDVLNNSLSIEDNPEELNRMAIEYDNIILNHLLERDIDEIFKTLTPKEARVLELRFGLKKQKKLTLMEVGREFGVQQERIRQIEAKALRKLRHPTRSIKLRDYI